MTHVPKLIFVQLVMGCIKIFGLCLYRIDPDPYDRLRQSSILRFGSGLQKEGIL
jgi:hypothetical protein